MTTVLYDSSEVTTILLDYCGVLADLMSPKDMQSLATLAGLEGQTDNFGAAYWQHRLAYDLAEITAMAYWQLIAQDTGFTWTPELHDDLVAYDVEVNTQVRSEAARWVEQAHQSGYKLGVLSNLPLELCLRVKAQPEWHGVFQTMLFSCEIERAKPSPEAFRLALNELESAPSSTLFIDDRQENLDIARHLGMHTRLRL